MKKTKNIIALVLSLMLILALPMAVSAQSAYSTIVIQGTNTDITLIQGGNDGRYGLMVNWWGPEGQWDGESELTAEHTAGGAYLDDIIRIENVDFGANGPSSVTLNVSNGDDSTEVQLGVFVGGTQVATLVNTYTGSWDDGVDQTAEISGDFTGVQTVEIKYMPDSDEMSSGTVFSISFTEKEPAPTVAEPEPEEVEEIAPATEDAPAPEPAPQVPAAPSTGDNFGLFCALALAICAFGIYANSAIKKAKKK